jgi:ubiquinone/menaquinone biosynthesis C-methylase UbiE
MNATSAPHVDPTNTEQLRAWDGDEGAYWADHADAFDRSIDAYRERFAAAAEVQVGDRVLDIGCGTGQTTREAARLARAGSALGVDLSSRMVELARRQAVEEGIGNVAFEQADAQVHPFEPQAFDVAISRTGAMFFGDPVQAFTNIARALRPGARLALLTWQPLVHNEWIREFIAALAAGRDLPGPPPSAPGPFGLSDPDRVRTILSTAAFVDIDLEGTSAEMWFGTDADDAYRFVLGLLGWMLEGLDDDGRTRALDALRSTTAAHEADGGVVYESSAWIVTARRA